MQPRILVPFDFSLAAERALCWATDLQLSLRAGALKLIHVLPLLPFATSEAPHIPPPSEKDVLLVTSALRDAAACFAPGSEVQVLVEGQVGPAVIAAAQSYAADLIVMGTYGRGGVSRLILGSVADYVVRHASCPVVTVRAPS